MLGGMPRVSAEHLEGRRNQILDAAARRFAANGFHSTSMQDILAESELSAGAVYRYFSGKEDIIAAIAERAMAAIRSALDEDASDRTLSEMVARALAAVDERTELDDVGRLALQVWAEAARSDTLRERLAGAVREGRAIVRDGIERRYGREVDAEAVAAVFVALIPGYVHAKVILGDLEADQYLRGLDGLAALLR